MIQRLTKLQARLKPHEALLLSRATDVSYFTQFHFLVPEEREALALITKNQTYLFHARFCPVKELAGIATIVASYPSQVVEQLKKLKVLHPFTTLLIDKSSLFVDEYELLQTINDLTFESQNQSWIWEIRTIKDTEEIRAITEASRIATQSYKSIKPLFKVGMTEKEVRDMLEAEMKKGGSEQPAFPTIVAFGDHSALPHHQPTDVKLEKNQPVLIDFGATVNGYKSDMTRTFWFGDEPDDEFLRIEQIVNDAYNATAQRLRGSKAQRTAKHLDGAARGVITDAGYADQFIHTTGHGVGLDIHEQPSLNYRNETPIQPGMVITIEPGIYLEGKYGYRYENTVLINETGCKELTLLSKSK